MAEELLFDPEIRALLDQAQGMREDLVNADPEVQRSG
jgi:hypothetical protein